MGDIAEMYRDQEYEESGRDDADDAFEHFRRDWLTEQSRNNTIAKRAQQGIWTQRDGTPIAVKDMSNRHLLNAYRLLVRKGCIGRRTLNAYMCDGPSGEMAQETFRAEQEQVFDAPVSPFIDLFEDEIKQRKLKVPEVEPEWDGDDR